MPQAEPVVIVEQPRRVVAVEERFSVSINEVRPSAVGAFVDVIFTINANTDESFLVSFSYRSRNVQNFEGITRITRELGEFQRGQNSALVPIIGVEGALDYAIEVCKERQCVQSESFNPAQ